MTKSRQPESKTPEKKDVGAEIDDILSPISQPDETIENKPPPQESETDRDFRELQEQIANESLQGDESSEQKQDNVEVESFGSRDFGNGENYYKNYYNSETFDDLLGQLGSTSKNTNKTIDAPVKNPTNQKPAQNTEINRNANANIDEKESSNKREANSVRKASRTNDKTDSELREERKKLIDKTTEIKIEIDSLILKIKGAKDTDLESHKVELNNLLVEYIRSLNSILLQKRNEGHAAGFEKEDRKFSNEKIIIVNKIVNDDDLFSKLAELHASRSENSENVNVVEMRQMIRGHMEDLFSNYGANPLDKNGKLLNNSIRHDVIVDCISSFRDKAEKNNWQEILTKVENPYKAAEPKEISSPSSWIEALKELFKGAKENVEKRKNQGLSNSQQPHLQGNTHDAEKAKNEFTRLLTLLTLSRNKPEYSEEAHAMKGLATKVSQYLREHHMFTREAQLKSKLEEVEKQYDIKPGKGKLFANAIKAVGIDIKRGISEISDTVKTSFKR